MPLNLSFPFIGAVRFAVNKAEERVNQMVLQYLQVAGAQGWQAIEPTGLTYLFESHKLKYKINSITGSVRLISVTISLRRLILS